MDFKPYEHLPGGFSTSDGTIDLYLRIRSLLNDQSVVLDLGAGRAAWYEDDQVELRRNIRLLKGTAKKVIAVDIDDAVMTNQASDEQHVSEDGTIPIDDKSVDVIVADYVMEHVVDPSKFFGEIDRVLRPGGWFCARTPHKFSYVCVLARLLSNKYHVGILKYAQKDKKEEDTFPTYYRMNTISKVGSIFSGYKNHSFIARADPAYFFNSRIVYNIQEILHRIMFSQFSGNLVAFLKKPE